MHVSVYLYPKGIERMVFNLLMLWFANMTVGSYLSEVLLVSSQGDTVDSNRCY